MATYEDRLALVTVFQGKGIERAVSAYADVQRIAPGLSYENPIATIDNITTNEVATVLIKPFTLANEDELAALNTP